MLGNHDGERITKALKRLQVSSEHKMLEALARIELMRGNAISTKFKDKLAAPERIKRAASKRVLAAEEAEVA